MMVYCKASISIYRKFAQKLVNLVSFFVMTRSQMFLFNGLTSQKPDLSRLLDSLSSNYGVSPDTAKHCLELALRKTMCEHFDVQECDVDLDAGIVTPILPVSAAGGLDPIWYFLNRYFRDKREGARMVVDYTNTTPGDLFPVEFSLEELRDVVRYISSDINVYFSKFLEEARSQMLDKKWRKRVHQAVEGVIHAKYPDRLDISLGDDARGVMHKPEWTPLETRSYREGKLLLFYALKLEYFATPGFIVSLSRGSIGLPGAILKTMAPWVKVKPIKRIRGRKTWLRVSPPVPGSLLREVSAKLNGEVIEVVND